MLVGVYYSCLTVYVVCCFLEVVVLYCLVFPAVEGFSLLLNLILWFWFCGLLWRVALLYLRKRNFCCLPRLRCCLRVSWFFVIASIIFFIFCDCCCRCYLPSEFVSVIVSSQNSTMSCVFSIFFRVHHSTRNRDLPPGFPPIPVQGTLEFRINGGGGGGLINSSNFLSPPVVYFFVFGLCNHQYVNVDIFLYVCVQ